MVVNCFRGVDLGMALNIPFDPNDLVRQTLTGARASVCGVSVPIHFPSETYTDPQKWIRINEITGTAY